VLPLHPLHIQLDEDRDVATVQLFGDLDAERAERVRVAVEAILADGPRHVTLDLSALDGIDDTAMEVLARARERAAPRVSLLPGQDQIRRFVAAAVGLPQVFAPAPEAVH
jgi:anti-anti-sigma factor